jgi:two-component system sensor histidine kinase KdpD
LAAVQLTRPVGTVAAAVLEIVASVAAATGGVAALESTAPAAGLGILYLLAVLGMAIRRGQLAALVTALLSVLTLNYLFIAPRHRLAVSHSQDVVELTVLLIAAIVVGRLAATGRLRAAEADSRAKLATAREREANLLAEAASAILGGPTIATELERIGKRVALATGASHARVELEAVPSPREGERTLQLPVRAGRAWLYVSDDAVWDEEDIGRIAEPLGGLLDVALERERLAERAAEAEAARRAESARTAILHAISHDFRSPLTAITTAGSALRGRAVTETERSELIDVIEAEGARLARLVDDLLDLSRIEAGALAPRADWCDLHDVVTSAAAHVGAQHPIKFSLPSDLPLVRADATQLERVFSNLIENAVKFSPPEGPIRVTGTATLARVIVRVSDTGPGIPKSQRSRVFEPFFRGREDGGTGSGLGLAICRGFVEANGGRITLQSTRPGGTSFAVSFPLTPQPAQLA